MLVANGCREFTGARSAGWHGTIRFEGRMEKAHRVAWILTNGPIPDGMWVLHHCDNPPCCEPTHLVLGDALANHRARAHTGRNNHIAGAAHHAYKITPEIRAMALRLRSEGQTQEVISKRTGISRGRIAHLVAGVLPKHIHGRSS